MGLIDLSYRTQFSLIDFLACEKKRLTSQLNNFSTSKNQKLKFVTQDFNNSHDDLVKPKVYVTGTLNISP